MIKAAVAVLTLAVVTESVLLWRQHSSHESAGPDPQVCSSVRATLAALGTPAEKSSGDYAMGQFRALVTPPIMKMCGIAFGDIAPDFDRTQECYIGRGSASCVGEAAGRIASMIK